MNAALKEGKGIICVSAHAGFWELTGFIFPAMGYPCVCIANRLPVPGINAAIRKIRARLGNEIVDQEGALVHILRALKEGKTVGIIMDHWGKSKAPLISFFGRDTRTVDTVARLHLKTGAPIISSMMIRQSDGRYWWRCKRILVPLGDNSPTEARINEILTLCNRDIEAAIRENPEQWTWMHNRWRDS
jgi:KDO2-lipid IV(A) lauroyltransferase